ncbi:MAG: hypothetical protein ACTSRE_16255 [Promethearchaeota archaeon]
MTESEEQQLESLCADVPYMFVLNSKNEIVYVVNDTQTTDSTTEEEYQQALDSFIARQYQFKSLYDIVNEQITQNHPKTHHKRLCMNCVGKSNVFIVHEMCVHEFIIFLSRVFHDRNIVQL